jgi:hypothetical protein
MELVMTLDCGTFSAAVFSANWVFTLAGINAIGVGLHRISIVLGVTTGIDSPEP